MREAMDGRNHLPHQPTSIPPGYEPARDALMRFHGERIDAIEARDRVVQQPQVTMLVTEALSAGSLVIFVRTMEGDVEPVPTDAWRSHPAEPSRQHANITRLHQTGRNHDDPLVLLHETFTASGIALVDRNNWAGFSRYAGKWPPYEIPAPVRLLLRFCEHKRAFSEGLPVRKYDAIEWFRHNWPPEMEHQWPASDRFHKVYNNKDNCPAFVSEFAHVVLDESERTGGALPSKWQKAVGDRRRRMSREAATAAEIEGGLGIVED